MITIPFSDPILPLAGSRTNEGGRRASVPRPRSFCRLPLIEKVAYGLSRRKHIAQFCLNGIPHRGVMTHVSEEAHTRNLTPHIAQGRRLHERLSRSAAPRTNARATENRLPHRPDRTSCRRRPTTAGRRRAFPR